MIFESLAVLGLGINVLGQLNGAAAQAEATRRNAAMKNAQADELLARQLINEEIMREDADYAALNVRTADGIDQTGVGQQLWIKKNLQRNLELSRREAEYKARMLRQGADIDMQLGSDLQSASYLSAAGSVLGGGADIYRRSDLYGKGEKSDDLFKNGNKKYGGYRDNVYAFDAYKDTA